MWCLSMSTNIVSAVAGIAAILLKIGKYPGAIKLTATADGLQPATITIDAKPKP